ncbi:PilN domain-containing protein [Tissierella sp. MSJ-40]|uniref:PilN domain-containing protein n=1 Tax=Tissierella simiarum TaxID=2841534 RepID=A0ABS6E3N3_9FIRM|nr:PilN domain-containing protein [Tissierella simiarum]MBU5437512.1 PilN domain-containing protein [Tissierella simiarum]
MKDLNFFELYIEKIDFKANKQIIYYAGVVILVLFLIFNIAYNQIRIKQLTREVEILKTTVEDKKIIKKVEEIKNKNEKVSVFRETVDKIKNFDRTIEDSNIVDNYLLNTITSKIPEDLFFTSMSLYNNSIQIVGISKDKISIAELEKGLETIEDFKEIFVSNISSQEDYYNFTINVTLKDVSINGEETTTKSEEQNEENDQE